MTMNINKKINALFGTTAVIAMIALFVLIIYLALFAPV